MYEFKAYCSWRSAFFETGVKIRSAGIVYTSAQRVCAKRTTPSDADRRRRALSDRHRPTRRKYISGLRTKFMFRIFVQKGHVSLCKTSNFCRLSSLISLALLGPGLVIQARLSFHKTRLCSHASLKQWDFHAFQLLEALQKFFHLDTKHRSQAFFRSHLSIIDGFTKSLSSWHKAS